MTTKRNTILFGVGSLVVFSTVLMAASMYVYNLSKDSLAGIVLFTAGFLLVEVWKFSLKKFMSYQAMKSIVSKTYHFNINLFTDKENFDTFFSNINDGTRFVALRYSTDIGGDGMWYLYTSVGRLMGVFASEEILSTFLHAHTKHY